MICDRGKRRRALYSTRKGVPTMDLSAKLKRVHELTCNEGGMYHKLSPCRIGRAAPSAERRLQV
jgi:hypothetical protein